MAVLVASLVDLSLGQRIVAVFAQLSGLFETAAAGVVSAAVAAPGVVAVAAPASAVVYACKVAAVAVVAAVVVVVDGGYGRHKYSLLVGAREANFAPSFAAPRLLAGARAA